MARRSSRLNLADGLLAVIVPALLSTAVIAHAGAPLSSEIDVATVPLSGSYPYAGAVAAAGDGRFVVAWHDLPESPVGTLGRVLAQRYSPAATPLGSPIEVFANNEGRRVVAAMDAVGNFAVATLARTSSDTFAMVVRSYAPDGTPRGPADVVGSADDAPPGIQSPALLGRRFLELRGPSIAMSADGSFALAWGGHSRTEVAINLPRALYPVTLTSRDYIQFRAYGPDGQPRSPVRTVDVESTAPGCAGALRGESQTLGRPTIAARPGGGYSVAWRNGFLQCGANPPALPPFSVRDYDGAGNALSGTHPLAIDDSLRSTYSPGVDDLAYAAGTAGDRWLAWSAIPRPGQPDHDAGNRNQRVWLRRFLADGTPAGPSLQIAPRRQNDPAVTPSALYRSPDGSGLSLSPTSIAPGVVVAWADDADEQVRARYYRVPAAGNEGAIQPREAAFDVGSYADYSARSPAQGWRASVGTATGLQDQLIAIWSAVKARLFSAP